MPYGDDENSNPSLKKTGTKYVFSIKDPQPEDAGFYQLDVDEANVLTTDFQGKAYEFCTINRMVVLAGGVKKHSSAFMNQKSARFFPPLLVPAVEFIAKIKDEKAVESEDAIFQCVLSTPLNRITWSRRDSSLEHGDKYEITVSEDKLIHTLRVKDCKMADNGAYYAIAGITSSTASLTVEGGASLFHTDIYINKQINNLILISET